MKKFVGGLVLVGLALSLVLSANRASADDPDPAVKKLFDKMLTAIKDNDRDAFVAEGTDTVKKGVTPEVMDAFSKQFGARLKKGYQATYLCQVKQAEHHVHLWKMTFKDDGDDVVVRIGLKDGKVGGFFLQ
jgi:ABC-type transporter MlaC component